MNPGTLLLLVASMAIVVLAAPQDIKPANPQHPGQSGYGRGVGTVPDQCGYNEEKAGALCYPNCEPGFYGVGPVCWEACQSDERDHGATCFRSIISWHWKKSKGRGGGHAPNSCPPGKEHHQELCYEPCKPGYKGLGPMCHYVGFN